MPWTKEASRISLVHCLSEEYTRAFSTSIPAQRAAHYPTTCTSEEICARLDLHGSNPAHEEEPRQANAPDMRRPTEYYHNAVDT